MILNLLDAGDFSGIFLIFRISVLLYAVVVVFKTAIKIDDRKAIFTGALGLGILTLSEILTLTSIFIKDENNSINIADYNDVASYLFFLSAIVFLLYTQGESHKILKYELTIISGAVIFATIYSVAINSITMIYIIMLSMAFICAVLSSYLLYQSKKIKSLKIASRFAYSMLCLCALDMLLYIFLVTGNGNLTSIFTAFYLPAYFFIAEGLMSLRNQLPVTESVVSDQ